MTWSDAGAALADGCRRLAAPLFWRRRRVSARMGGRPRQPWRGWGGRGGEVDLGGVAGGGESSGACRRCHVYPALSCTAPAGSLPALRYMWSTRPKRAHNEACSVDGSLAGRVPLPGSWGGGGVGTVSRVGLCTVLFLAGAPGPHGLEVRGGQPRGRIGRLECEFCMLSLLFLSVMFLAWLRNLFLLTRSCAACSLLVSACAQSPIFCVARMAGRRGKDRRCASGDVTLSGRSLRRGLRRCTAWGWAFPRDVVSWESGR